MGVLKSTAQISTKPSLLFAANAANKEGRLINEVFSFVDASHLIAKANLWKERDDAISEFLNHS